jgi:hypothetical protein
MPCHILLSWPRARCGIDFSKLEKPHPHSYVEELGRRLEMADCKECRKSYHQAELDRIEDEE